MNTNQASEIRHINSLLQLFFDGATSLAQEKELQRYFTTVRPLPSELEPYAPMFAWYADGLRPEALPEEPEAPAPSISAPAKWHSRWSRKAIAWWSSAAAVVAVAIAIGWNHHADSLTSPIDLSYADSYIMRDGITIRGAEEIAPELEATRLEALNLEQEIDALMDADDAGFQLTTSPVNPDTLPI